MSKSSATADIVECERRAKAITYSRSVTKAVAATITIQLIYTERDQCKLRGSISVASVYRARSVARTPYITLYRGSHGANSCVFQPSTLARASDI